MQIWPRSYNVQLFFNICWKLKSITWLFAFVINTCCDPSTPKIVSRIPPPVGNRSSPNLQHKHYKPLAASVLTSGKWLRYFRARCAFLARKSLGMPFRSTLSLNGYISFPNRHMLDLSLKSTLEAINPSLPLKKCYQRRIPENFRHFPMNCI